MRLQPDPAAQLSRVLSWEMMGHVRPNPGSTGGDVARDILEQYAEDHFGVDAAWIPSIESLRRRANKMRRDSRPAEPRDLDCEIGFQAIPDKFPRGDIREGAGRDLIFASYEQLEILKRPHTWYGGGALKLAGNPFKQLYALHAFVLGARGSIKQVPLVFVLMSHRRQEDYAAVLAAPREIAPGAQPTAFVMDFEMAFWLAVSEASPSAERRGCFFRRRQRVYRKIHKLGLASAYESNPGKRHFMREAMSLPLLPADDAPEAFDFLGAVNPYEQLKPLLANVRRAWFFNTTVTPEPWQGGKNHKRRRRVAPPSPRPVLLVGPRPLVPNAWRRP